MSILVVTGTDTGVGKTVVAAAVAALARGRGSSVAVVKPAQTALASGDAGDLDTVIRLSGVTTTFELCRYSEPLSPAAAARVGGLPPVSLADVARLVRELAESNRLVIVEGTGGLLERYDEDGGTIADLARSLGGQVLVVVGAGSGSVNQAALTLEALAHRGLEPVGLVIGRWPEEPGVVERSNVADLEMLAARPLAGALPERAGGLGREAFAQVARKGLGPALGGVFDPSAFRQQVL
ncbi:ATP-dependent dethiobiotin synthetase BioD [Nonomuraea turkmeniaca]|uniref:ATP-dependent dethiobiotin synthetase BioD n=1 Tax=Nonomuraea turkmeniaca TaxID=103838 RepID=A0A5S4FH53_9ACTN|nr:dethiobiotin synthase [Nonomuraea turkmeniaca]TMR18048.1 ATP-dependent dethiobiotin synthetase BioD [Nonomuraea turkmeniaca]